MRPKVSLSEVQWQDIKSRRDNGETQKVIAGDYGRSAQWLSSKLKDGHKYRGKVTPRDYRDILRRRAAGEKLRVIAKSYDVSVSYIADVCRGRLTASRPSRPRKVAVSCLKCDGTFETKLVGRVPEKRICPECTEDNKMFCGALI